jgi:hypothetical protein
VGSRSSRGKAILFLSVGGSLTKGVSIRPSADHPFHFSQLYIILDRTTNLLDIFAQGLQDGEYPVDSTEYVIVLPFSPSPFPLELVFPLNFVYLILPHLAVLAF